MVSRSPGFPRLSPRPLGNLMLHLIIPVNLDLNSSPLHYLQAQFKFSSQCLLLYYCLHIYRSLFDLHKLLKLSTSCIFRWRFLTSKYHPCSTELRIGNTTQASRHVDHGDFSAAMHYGSLGSPDVPPVLETRSSWISLAVSCYFSSTHSIRLTASTCT